MNIVGMPYNQRHPILGEHPAYTAAASLLVNIMSRRQAEHAALEELQRKAPPGIEPPQALAAQIRNQQRYVAAFDLAIVQMGAGRPF